MDWRERIVIDPDVLAGKPVVRGTRIPVELVVDLLGRGWSADDIVREYEHLRSEDILACLLYVRDTPAARGRSKREPPVARAWHDIYGVVPGHQKPGFGFWMPDHVLSAEDVARAVQWARDLQGPSASWYRCQELAQTAQGAPTTETRRELLREAFAEADAQTEPNRIVTVASWPLRALLDAGELPWFEQELSRLLETILPEPNPFRRQDGLYALLFCDAPQTALDRVAALYEAACAGVQKVQTMRRTAQYLCARDQGRARDLCLLIRDPRRRRQALRAIGEATERGPGEAGASGVGAHLPGETGH